MRLGQAIILTGSLSCSAAFIHPLQESNATPPPAGEIVDCEDALRALADDQPIIEEPTRGRDDATVSRLTPELIDQVLDVLHEIDPARAKSWRKRYQTDPERFTKSLASNSRGLIALTELKARDPKLYGFKLEVLKFDHEVERAANHIRALRKSGRDTESQERELKALITKQQVFEIAVRGMYLQRLREHIDKLEKDIDQAVGNVPAEVDARMARLLGNTSVSSVETVARNQD